MALPYFTWLANKSHMKPRMSRREGMVALRGLSDLVQFQRGQWCGHLVPASSAMACPRLQALLL